MKTVPLSEARGYIQPVQTAASSEAALYAEVSERLLELVSLTSIVRVNGWLGALMNLRERNYVAQLWFLRIQTGDLGWLTKSYGEIGGGTAMTKQAVEQGFDRALDEIKQVRPEVHAAIVEYRSVKECKKDSTKPDFTYVKESFTNGIGARVRPLA
jgi:hypothetical protein